MRQESVYGGMRGKKNWEEKGGPLQKAGLASRLEWMAWSGQTELEKLKGELEVFRTVERKLWMGVAVVCLCGVPMLAQVPVTQPPPPSPPSSAPPAPKKNADNAVQSAPDQPMWDPLRADKDMNVGKYYMKKGDLDAAIDRFEDAALAKPGFALPYLYLGELYEKQGKKKPAVKAYQRYLDLNPKAEDGDKIRKKVEKLHQEIDKDKKDIS